MKYTLTFLFACFMLGIKAQTPAETVTILGRVINSANGNGIAKAVVLSIVDENIGVVSDENGYYRLEIPKEKYAKNMQFEVKALGFIKMEYSARELKNKYGIKLTSKEYICGAIIISINPYIDRSINKEERQSTLPIDMMVRHYFAISYWN